MQRINLTKTLVVSLLTVIILVVWFLKIDILDIVEILKQTDAKLLILAIFVSIAGKVIVSSERWRQILKSLGCNLSFKETVFIKMASSPIKLIFPAKSAELLRVLYLKKEKDFSIIKGTSSLLAALILNLLVLVSFAMFACFLFRMNPYNIGYISFFISASLLITLFSFRIGVGKNFILKALGKIHSKLYQAIEVLMATYRNLSFHDIALFFAYSLIAIGFELINFYILSSALGLSIPYQTILVFIPAVIILSNLPVTIGGLGTRETATVFFLSKYAAIEPLFSVGILFSFIEYILPAMIGVIFTRQFLNRIISLKHPVYVRSLYKS